MLLLLSIVAFSNVVPPIVAARMVTGELKLNFLSDISPLPVTIISSPPDTDSITSSNESTVAVNVLPVTAGGTNVPLDDELLELVLVEPELLELVELELLELVELVELEPVELELLELELLPSLTSAKSQCWLALLLLLVHKCSVWRRSAPPLPSMENSEALRF